MADTTRWTLQDFANMAGQGVGDVPAPEYIPPDGNCLGCGTFLGEMRAKNGMRRVYCGAACMLAYHRRRSQHGEVERDLTLGRYSW